MKTTFSHKNLKKSTPAKLKKLGNAMVAASVAGSGLAFITDHEAMAITVFIFGFVGRGIVEFFTEEE